MKDFRRISRAKVLGLLGKVQRYQLFLACMVIVLCFAIGNDVYAAKTVAQRHKDLLNGPRREFNYQDAVNRRAFRKGLRADTERRFLVDPKASVQPNMISALLVDGSDICANPLAASANPQIFAFPYNTTGTTVGYADDYNITGDPTGCPSPTCEATSGTFPDRGYAYSGTGTGPDVAYRIVFTATANLVITLDPTDPAGTADDLALLFYGEACSSSPSDAIVLADNSGSGNPPDLADNSEVITVTQIPAGKYNIVVDAYSAAGDPITSGPYSLSVNCIGGATPCVAPAPRRTRRSDY
ncbi:MAG: hypothetical protein IPI64_09845 [Chloracidobacterium sp.]|nr:hypothetical protein [Chloracidobacterium sp.]